MQFMKSSVIAATVAAAASLAVAQNPPESPHGTARVPSIKLTYGYNPLHDEAMRSSVVRRPHAGRVPSVINTGASPFIRDQDQQYVCEVIRYMDGTKVLRVGQVYIELRDVGLEEAFTACARTEVLRSPKRAADDDKARTASTFETCPLKVASARGRCQSDKDTCCTRPSKLIADSAELVQ